MKKFKVTNRGKILLTSYFIAMIASYFFAIEIFYVLGGLLFALIGIELINYLINRFKKSANEDKILSEKQAPHIEVKTLNKEISIESESKDNDEPKIPLRTVIEDKVVNKDNREPTLKENKNESMVGDSDSIEEDIEAMKKDLEVIGKKADKLQKESIQNYFIEKKNVIYTASNDTSFETPDIIEEKSLIDTFLEWLKESLNFKKYKKGNLVLHEHFGIGKIISTEETLKVSFINDLIEEVIEFEYDKNKKIPELNLFKAPKGEDERQYYYNYKRDISEALENTIKKISLNLPDIEYQRNIFLKSGSTFETYDFIAISDQVHVFSQSEKLVISSELLEGLLEDIDVKVIKHRISDYSSINSILLKAKIKGIMSLELMSVINERIKKGNVKDFNERMQFIDD